MKRMLTAALVVAIAGVALIVARQRSHRDATPGPLDSAAAAATATPARPAGSVSRPAPSPAPAQVRPRLDEKARADMLRRIEAARRHAAGPAKPATPVEDQPLDEAYIHEQIQALIPQLTECYSNALRRKPNLGGEMVVDFSIVGDPGVGGLVGDSKINAGESTIADSEMGECVQETMYAAQFVPPKAGGEVRVSFPFVFKSGAD